MKTPQHYQPTLSQPFVSVEEETAKACLPQFGRQNGPRIITILGGGSVWTPELLLLFSRIDAASNWQIRLHGPTRSHLDAVASFTQLTLKTDLNIRVMTDLKEAVHRADIILCQARVGGWQARLTDETLPVKLGGIGDESLGLGGIRAANRSWPFVQRAARVVAELAPCAWVLNLTNPCDLICRALRKAGCRQVVGLCEHPQMRMRDWAVRAGRPESEGQFGFFGIIHVGWATPPAGLGLERVLEDQRSIESWLREWQALPTPWRMHLADPDHLARSQRLHPGQRARFLMNLVDRLRRSILDHDLLRYRADIGERELPWFPEAVVPAVSALLRGKPARLVVGLPNNRRFPDLHPDVQIEGWAALDEHGVVPESYEVSQRCEQDIIRFAQTRDLAYIVAQNPEQKALERYINIDPLARGVGPRADLRRVLQFSSD